MKTIIENTTIIKMNESKNIINGSIIIENNKISEITKDELTNDHKNDADEILNGKDLIVMPGMINAHYHSYSNLLKGTVNNLPLELWSLYTTSFGRLLDDEDIYNAVLLGAAEMLKNGITSCIDHFPHINRSFAALKAYKESAMRVDFAPMMHDYKDHHFVPVNLPKELENELNKSPVITPEEFGFFFDNLEKEWKKDTNKINLMLGPNAPQRCTNEMLALCAELKEKRNLKVQTHLLETKIQKEIGGTKFESGLLKRMCDYGLADQNLSAAHAIWLDPKEVNMLKEKNISVVHNPSSNMILGSGVAPISEYVENGINVALGTDASNCGTSHNLFEAMRFTAMLNRITTSNFDKWIDPNDVFKMATIGGATISDSKTNIKRGEIKEGYVADIVLLNRKTESLAMQEDVISQIVFYETGSSVVSVMVDGEWVVKDKKILTFDEDKVIDSMKYKHESLMKRSKQEIAKAKKLEVYYRKVYS